MAALSPCMGRWSFCRRPRRSTAALGLAGDRRKQGIDLGFTQTLQRFGQVLGQEWRGCAVRLTGSASPSERSGTSRALTVGLAENRSGVVSVGRLFGIPSSMPLPFHCSNRPCVGLT